MLLEVTPQLRARKEIVETLIELFRCNIPNGSLQDHTVGECRSILAEYVGDVVASSSDGNHVRHRPVLEIAETVVMFTQPRQGGIPPIG